MRCESRHLLLVAGFFAAACQSTTGNTPVGTLPPPSNLAYQLDVSGDPTRPAGILLSWTDENTVDLSRYRVYSRPSTTAAFGLRGETTSNSFHDNGVPDLEYYVTAVDVGGGESGPSTSIVVDQRLELQAPLTLSSISLDSAIHLDWADNAFLTDPTRFKWYRVYSAGFNAVTGVCDTSWALEGTTVSHEFLAAQLPNGVSQCFGVSAVSVEGYESLWSPLQEDTPRPDARNVLVWADAVNSAQSGFRFWDDLNGNGYGDPGELGLVESGTRTDIDFALHLNASDSTLWIVPVFTGDSLQLYQNAPIADVTSIHTAPATGYARTMLQAVPGYGYVFERVENGLLHYAGLRVTAVSRQYAIVDWSVQTDPGNPDLMVLKAPALTGLRVTTGSR